MPCLPAPLCPCCCALQEDLIIPHSYSFYDLIVTKARGKSGPLFHFDVHDDVRVIQVGALLLQCSHGCVYLLFVHVYAHVCLRVHAI